MNSCLDQRPAGALADEEALRRAARARASRDRPARRRARGRRRPADRPPARQQLGIAGTGADERHEASLRLRLVIGAAAGPVRGPLPIVQVVQRVEQQRPPLVHRHAVRQPPATRLVRARHPAVEVLGQKHLERLAQQAGQRRRVAAGRDRDRHAGLPHDRAEIRARVRQVVDRVDEQAARLGRPRHRAVHLGRRRRHDEPRAVEVVRLERPADNREIGGHRRNGVDDVGSHDRNARAGVHERAQLSRRHWPGADHEDAPPFELEEHGENRHGPPVVAGSGRES